jgi:5'-deoxynucleotidase YfbR-like HD superfamily hydrolase
VSTARYFVTEQEEAAKNWEILQKSKNLEARVVRLQDELRQFSLDWSLPGKKACERDFSYRVDGENIEILRVDVVQTRTRAIRSSR